MSIKILKPGILATLVADERKGFRSIGVGPGGAMDNFAMTAGNYLLGNSEREASIEFWFPAIEILFQRGLVACFTGKGFELRIDDVPLPLWKPIEIREGSTIKLVKSSSGACVYLAVRSGWKAQNWLGSFGTHLGVKAGGYKGRSLQINDIVETNFSETEVGETKALPWGISDHELRKVYSPSSEIRITPCIETELLTSLSTDRLLSDSFVINSQSNRMGYRLNGLPLSLSRPMELISSPVDYGTIQLLPDGNLIILMADHQTTGGYPRIASVIKADLPKLAQIMPGEKINFKMVSLPEAETELCSRANQLAELKTGCQLRFNDYFK